jgi:hypothetical protein
MRRLLGALILLVSFFSLPALAEEGQPRYAFFPEFFSGNGWICEIFFTNQDILGVPGIEIAFYDNDGSPVSVDSNLGNDTSYSFSLGAGATQVIRINPESAYVEGYAVITYPSPGWAPVRATLVFRYDDGNGNVTAEAGVPQQEYAYHFSFPVEINSSQSISTAFAIVNPQIYVSADQVMLFNLIGTDGVIDATARVLLAPGEHFVRYLDQLFPQLDNFAGSMSISSAFGAGVVAFRQDANAFGAISTDYGPILGPFATGINDLASDQEPNNSFAQAQLINGSTLIRQGTIYAQNDKDYFKFTGQQGDVLSVICDAEMTGSLLDSMLEIYAGSISLENPIAINDQNGLSPALYPLDDSFIQVELPANDTYYIMLRDYFNEGDPTDFYYDLYIKITPGSQ